jgi:hypothetical protein
MNIHENMPEAEYHALDRASQSTLKKLLPPWEQSPEAVRCNMLNPTPSSPAQRLGSALHAMLDGHLDEQFMVGPTKSRNSKAWHEADAESNGITLLTGEEIDTVAQMATAIDDHSRARALLEKANQRELTLSWDQDAYSDSGTACPCKARLDLVVQDPPCIVDVKTTESAAPGAFQRSITKWGYQYQAGFYLEAAEQAKLFDAEATAHYVWIVVEKVPPYQVAVYRFDPAAAYQSWEQLIGPLQTMAQCYATGKWPGYTEEVQDIGLPTWAAERALLA